MIYLWFVIWICINSCFAQQYYDPSDCSSEPRNGSRYECQYSFQNSCTTFLVYRANRYFQTISSISDLFNLYSTEVLQQNSVTSSDEILKPGREVLVPINCFCSDPLFQTNVSYKVLSNTTFSEIACGVFEGLLKSPILSEANPSQGKEPKFGSELQVPLRCACPDNFTRSKRVKFLVTYPFIEGDETGTLSKKFGISPEDLWVVNHLEPKPTVFPNTTDLIPLKKVPVMDFSVPDPPPPTPAFLPTISNGKKPKSTKSRNLYMAISIAGVILVLIALVACDILVEIKYSLFMYSIEDLKKATRGLSEENKIGGEVYKGDFSCSYLVFEFPNNGCLRHCLSNPLQWHRRTQIAFDIATGLHYLHYCTFLPLAHLSMSSTNIFVTTNWRAKLANIGTSAAVGPVKEMDGKDSVRGWVAPEYLQHGPTSEKVDIFAFGVILLELISAWEDLDGKSFKESITFLGGASEGGCFEQLRSFMDPSLKDDYPLADALCLAVLAKACLEDDPSA
nr:serine/threonine receptor-like kinase nfp [Quercus suber]